MEYLFLFLLPVLAFFHLRFPVLILNNILSVLRVCFEKLGPALEELFQPTFTRLKIIRA